MESSQVFILVWEGERGGMRGTDMRRSAKKNSKERNIFVIIWVKLKVRNKSAEIIE